MQSDQLPTTALPSNTDSELDEYSDPDEAADISVEVATIRVPIERQETGHRLSIRQQH